MTNLFLFIALLITQFVAASPLSDAALRMIKIGNEVSSPTVVKNAQDLLIKGMFELNDFDAAYEASRQVRSGNRIMGYPPQVQIANKILRKLLNQGYDPAIYDSALYLLNGDNGFAKDKIMALNLFEKSMQMYSNPQSAFAAAIIRNESFIPTIKDKRRINELITFAILNNVKGAIQYQEQYINK